MKKIELKSYAKINLALDVVGKLPNGYHQLDGVMQIVDIFDIVTITLEEGHCKEIKVEITSTSNNIPLGKGNIVYKAYEKIKEKYEKKNAKSISEDYRKLTIHIEKNIPIEAGLAGGSGNGAVTLLGLDNLLNLGLSYEELMVLGKSIGADVPFSMSGQIKGNEEKFEKLKGKGFYAARTEGIGELLTRITPYEGIVLISKPNIGVSTKEVYENLNLNEISKKPNVEEMINALQVKNFKKLKENMINILEKYCEKRYNDIVYTKHKMKQHVKVGKVLMTGSGPTVFALSPQILELENAFKEISLENSETFIVKTMS